MTRLGYHTPTGLLVGAVLANVALVAVLALALWLS